MFYSSNSQGITSVARYGASRGLILLMTVVITGVASLASAESPTRGGSLSVGVESGFLGFDAIAGQAMGPATATAASTVQERLFNRDANGKLIPALGLSASPAKDGKAWTIKLRQGVKFHDGTPFNADAVVHHWKRLLNPENRFRSLLLLKPIASVEKVDEFTVRFNLRHPLPLFPGPLASHRAIWSYIPSPKAVDEGVQNRAPVGTGPFMFKKWESGNRFIVVRNPEYWQKELPYLGEIVFRFMPDPETRFSSLKSGEVDLIRTDRGRQVPKAKKDQSLVVYEKAGNGGLVILLNTSKPPLDDRRVRRALAHAWNQQEFVKVSLSNAVPCVQHPCTATQTCEDIDYAEWDLKEAKRLLAEYGKPVTVEVAHSTTPRGREIGAISQQFFKKIGVAVKLAPVDYLALARRVFTNNYQISGYPFFDSTDMGPFLLALFYSKSPWNLTHYNNPEMDKFLETLQITADPQKRKELICAVARLINRDAIMLYAGGQRHYYFARTEVKGIGAIWEGIIDLSGVWLAR